jgi:DUF3102 family protein
VTAVDSDRLPTLAAEIRVAHEAVLTAAQSAVERAIEAGKLLIEAKRSLDHSEWLPWLKEAGISPRTAQKYMRLAQLPDANAKRVAHLGVRKALAAISKGWAVHGMIRVATAAATLILCLLESADAATGNEELSLWRQIAKWANELTDAISGFKTCIKIDLENWQRLAAQGRWSEIDADLDDAEETEQQIELLNGVTAQMLARMDELGVSL